MDTTQPRRNPSSNPRWYTSESVDLTASVSTPSTGPARNSKNEPIKLFPFDLHILQPLPGAIRRGHDICSPATALFRQLGN